MALMSCSKSRTALLSRGELEAQPGQAAMPIRPRVRPATREAIPKRQMYNVIFFYPHDLHVPGWARTRETPIPQE
jgi:hypothetical protein